MRALGNSANVHQKDPADKNLRDARGGRLRRRQIESASQ
jgi:hypothetical protein